VVGTRMIVGRKIFVRIGKQMKIRAGFVSNSSSSSFVVAFDKPLKDELDLLCWLRDIKPNKYKNYKIGTESFDSIEFNIVESDFYTNKTNLFKKALDERIVPLGELFENVINVFDKDVKFVTPDNFEEYQNKIKEEMKHSYWNESDREHFNKKYINVTYDEFFDIVKTDLEHLYNTYKKMADKAEQLGGYIYEFCLSSDGDGINIWLEEDNDDGINVIAYHKIIDNLDEFNKHLIERWGC
jgi:hypothetical protein